MILIHCVYLQLRKYIYTRLGVLTTIHVTYIKKERLYTINSLCLTHCIRDEKEGKWEKEWKDRGKLYSLARGFNRAGGFLRLGVVDLERKRFCIFLLRGRRDKRGWTAMVEIIRQMEELVGRRTDL